MKKLMHILFLSCFKATELVEKRMHIKLSFKETFQLKIHLMMCDACSKYEKQSLILEKGIQNMKPNEDMTIDIAELKNRINSKLQQNT
jgi:hypothetical protein